MNLSKSKRMIVLLLLSLIAGLVYLTPFLRFSFYDQMKTALGLTDVQMGVIGGTYGALNVLSYIPSGFLTERFNTKRLLLISMLGMLACTLWYATYPPFAALVVIHALYGVFSVGTFWCPYLKAIRNLASEESQGTIFGLSEGLRGVGQTAVAFLCLTSLQFFVQVAAGFRAVILINAGAFALLFVATLLLVPDFDRRVGEQGKQESVKETLANMFRCLKDPGIWICIFVIMCGYALWNTVNGYIGTYTTRVLHLPPSVSSVLSILRSYIIVFVAGTTGGFLLDRFRFKGTGMRLFYLCCLLITAGTFFTERMVFLCAVFTILAGYFVNVIKSTYWSILGSAGIPPEATGRATGIISLIALTPDIFVPPVISQFLDWGERTGSIEQGFHLMLAWMAVWSILGIAAASLLKRRQTALSGTAKE